MVRSDEYDAAEMFKRLQRQVSDLRGGDTGESVTIIQNTHDTGVVTDTIGFNEYAIGFGGAGTADAVDLNTAYNNPQQFTVSFLVRSDEFDTNYRTLVYAGTNFILLEAAGDISFRVPGVATTNFRAGQLFEGEVAHVAVSYDQSDRVIYVDGEEVGRETIGPGTVAFPANWSLGASDNVANTLGGAIDRFYVHNRALSETEVRVLARHMVVDDGLVGSWPFDEGPGSTPTDPIAAVSATLVAGADYAGPLEWEYDPGFVWESDRWSADEW